MRRSSEWERELYGTGATEGDGTGIEASGDGGRRLDVEDDERRSIGGVGSRRSELEVGESPTQCLHAFLASVNRHQHAAKVSATRHRCFLSCFFRVSFSLFPLSLTSLACFYGIPTPSSLSDYNTISFYFPL